MAVDLLESHLCAPLESLVLSSQLSAEASQPAAPVHLWRGALRQMHQCIRGGVVSICCRRFSAYTVGRCSVRSICGVTGPASRHGCRAQRAGRPPGRASLRRRPLPGHGFGCREAGPPRSRGPAGGAPAALRDHGARHLRSHLDGPRLGSAAGIAHHQVAWCCAGPSHPAWWEQRGPSCGSAACCNNIDAPICWAGGGCSRTRFSYWQCS